MNLHLVLNHALGQAVRWGMLSVNPAAGAQPPRPNRPEVRAVDPSLAERILVAAKATRYELPVVIALATGMRRGEILGLRWSDLDPDLGAAHVRRSIQPTTSGIVVAEPETDLAKDGMLRTFQKQPGSIRYGLADIGENTC